MVFPAEEQNMGE
jgi:hypothetical protein